MCMNTNLNNWYTFDETLERPHCKLINGIKLKSYSCAVDNDSFNLGFKSFNLTDQDDNRVIVFQTINQCNEALEAWEANGY